MSTKIIFEYLESLKHIFQTDLWHTWYYCVCLCLSSIQPLFSLVLFYKVQILIVHYLWETDVQPFAAATSSDKNIEQELSKKWFFPILPLSNRDEDYFGTSNANDRFWLSRLHCKFTFASIYDTGIFKSKNYTHP